MGLMITHEFDVLQHWHSSVDEQVLPCFHHTLRGRRNTTLPGRMSSSMRLRASMPWFIALKPAIVSSCDQALSGHMVAPHMTHVGVQMDDPILIIPVDAAITASATEHSRSPSPCNDCRHLHNPGAALCRRHCHVRGTYESNPILIIPVHTSAEKFKLRKVHLHASLSRRATAMQRNL